MPFILFDFAFESSFIWDFFWSALRVASASTFSFDDLKSLLIPFICFFWSSVKGGAVFTAAVVASVGTAATAAAGATVVAASFFDFLVWLNPLVAISASRAIEIVFYIFVFLLL